MRVSLGHPHCDRAVPPRVRSISQERTQSQIDLLQYFKLKFFGWPDGFLGCQAQEAFHKAGFACDAAWLALDMPLFMVLMASIPRKVVLRMLAI